jgi:soluble P-type ATPase
MGMKEVDITIPHYGTLLLRHVVLDYNGTIARDGILKEEVKALLPALCERYRVHVITADTFGTVETQLEGYDVKVHVLTSDAHTREKALYTDSLINKHCVAIGNGNNDAKMLEDARLGIAVIGDEGCSYNAMKHSDIVCNGISDALELLLNDKRLVATLRK